MVSEAGEGNASLQVGINPNTNQPYDINQLGARRPRFDPWGTRAEPAAAVQNIDNPAEPSQPAPSANPFGAMAGQLGAYATPQTTNTGGTLKQTPTGQVHTASATNPNAQTTCGCGSSFNPY
jgi:hypothetical protein